MGLGNTLSTQVHSKDVDNAAGEAAEVDVEHLGTIFPL